MKKQLVLVQLDDVLKFFILSLPSNNEKHVPLVGFYVSCWSSWVGWRSYLLPYTGPNPLVFWTCFMTISLLDRMMFLFGECSRLGNGCGSSCQNVMQTSLVSHREFHIGLVTQKVSVEISFCLKLPLHWWFCRITKILNLTSRKIHCHSLICWFLLASVNVR